VTILATGNTEPKTITVPHCFIRSGNGMTGKNHMRLGKKDSSE
jgi:hypothetical protein